MTAAGMLGALGKAGAPGGRGDDFTGTRVDALGQRVGVR